MSAEFHIADAKPEEAAEVALCRQACEVLNKHYPGHLWEAEAVDGLLVIRNNAFRGRWGFVLKPEHYFTDPGLKCVMRAAGELLERHRIARSGRTESTYDPARIGHLRPAPA